MEPWRIRAISPVVHAEAKPERLNVVLKIEQVDGIPSAEPSVSALTRGLRNSTPSGE
jgi:hypothetical protein